MRSAPLTSRASELRGTTEQRHYIPAVDCFAAMLTKLSPTCRFSHESVQHLCLRGVGLRGRCGLAEPLCTAAGGGYCEWCRTVGAKGKQAAEGKKVLEQWMPLFQRATRPQ